MHVVDTPSHHSEQLPKLPELVIRPQTAPEEFEYLWYVLGRMPFYREHGYTVALPEHFVFQGVASQSSGLENVDREGLRQLFESEVYDPRFFDKGLSALESVRSTIESVFPSFNRFHEKWGFRLYPEYEATLTRYGPGGSYYPENGKILMLTKADGSFRRSHPAHTPIHEMVHLGIEEEIVERFGLSHLEKDRLVDLICVAAFGDILPEYSIQQRGDRRIDPFITAETLENLPDALSRYVQYYPRQ